MLYQYYLMKKEFQMPKNGYWIECIPVCREANQNGEEFFYNASVHSFPEIKVTADSPERAIAKLRFKLRAIRRYYQMIGRSLPEMDNPVRPPSRLRSVRGWISVYIQMVESGDALRKEG
jgi:hypothetical protein